MTPVGKSLPAEVHRDAGYSGGLRETCQAGGPRKAVNGERDNDDDGVADPFPGAGPAPADLAPGNPLPPQQQEGGCAGRPHQTSSEQRSTARNVSGSEDERRKHHAQRQREQHELSDVNGDGALGTRHTSPRKRVAVGLIPIAAHCEMHTRKTDGSTLPARVRGSACR